MTIEEAREEYRLNKIDIHKLHDVFFELATEEQIDEYWKIPLWDRPLFVIGKSKKERDAEWNSMINP